VAVIGPNGAGNLTLIRAISGALKASAGEIVYKFQRLHAISNMERARILGDVPQAQLTAGSFTIE
jgi:ABC-type cobalamin/Fe3+-siderophores transport system ATPase subunit